MVPYGASGVSVPEQKYRDVLQLLYAMTDGRTAYCVMGIENQAEINYALPVRSGVYVERIAERFQLSESEAVKLYW